MSLTPCCRDTHRQTGHLSLRMRSRVVDPVLQGHSSSNWSSQSEDEVSCRWSLGTGKWLKSTVPWCRGTDQTGSSLDCRQTVPRCIDNRQTVPRCIDNRQTVPRCIDNRQTVPCCIDNGQTLSRCIDNGQTVPHCIDNLQTVSRCIDSRQTVQCYIIVCAWGS